MSRCCGSVRSLATLLLLNGTIADIPKKQNLVKVSEASQISVGANYSVYSNISAALPCKRTLRHMASGLIGGTTPNHGLLL